MEVETKTEGDVVRVDGGREENGEKRGEEEKMRDRGKEEMRDGEKEEMKDEGKNAIKDGEKEEMKDEGKEAMRDEGQEGMKDDGEEEMKDKEMKEEERKDKGEDVDKEKMTEEGTEEGKEREKKIEERGEKETKKKAEVERLTAMNSNVKADTVISKKERMRYLLSQSKIFRHFLGEEFDSIDEGSGKKHRMTEAEEDAILLKEESNETQTTRLRTQPENIRGKMRPYQIEGLNFMIGLYERGLNGILADEMGLGKTLQTISLLAFMRLYKGFTGPHLIIVPKSTLGNWEKEIERWCPEIRVVRFHGNQEERKEMREKELLPGKFDVCLTSYEMVTKEKTVLVKFTWRYLIIDEAHRIKNENSILSQMVRIFETQNRLLITGTPLQNNLRELWALLNFLLPDVFSSATDFDSWFSSVEGGPGDDAEEANKNEMVHQLHTVLRPFLIRRLKSDVETDLPPKKETVLYLKLTPLQEALYRNILKKDVDAINFSGGDRVRLLNILMQLRKCCNHPYLFDGVEDRSLDPFGEHLVESCGKLAFLDSMLQRLKEGGHRVLIFSQMTRVLDILEDYCCDRMRGYKYCRIDGTTDGESRDTQIEEFNRPGSEKFIFLLSTRAGGLGINLATADTVILYDSDWNPQADLQAMDRAHRIGQKKPVNVYRLVMEKTLEERILRKAMEKLHLDSLVIQSGRLAEQKKNLQKDDLLDIIRYGADSFFKVNTDAVEEIDLDVILARGEEKTKEMNAELQKTLKTSNVNPMDFKLEGVSGEKSTMYQYEGVDYTGQKNIGVQDKFFLDVGKRTGRGKLDEGAYTRDSRPSNVQRPKQRLKPPKEPALNDFQFCNPERLRELYEEEKAVIDDFNARCEEAAREGKEEPAPPEMTLSAEKVKEREALLKNGFPDWLKRDYNMFLRACERHGRDDLDAICKDMADTKSPEQVRAYAQIFWTKGPTALDSWSKVVRAIEEGEAKIARRKDIERSLMLKVNRYEDAFQELEVPYNGNKGKQFIEEEDRWLICMAHKLGYGRWEELKSEVRRAPDFRFNWFIKSRTPVELKRRLDILVRIVEKENEEIAVAERAAARKKRASLSSTRGKKPADGTNALAKLKSPKEPKQAGGKMAKIQKKKGPKSTKARSESPSKISAPLPSKKPAFSPPNKAASSPLLDSTLPPDQKPASSPKKKPASSPKKKPVSSPAKKPASSPARKPTSSPARKPASSPARKPVSSPARKPASSSTRKPASSPTRKPASSLPKKPASSLPKKPASSLPKKPASPLPKKPASSPTTKPISSPKPKALSATTKRQGLSGKKAITSAKKVSKKPKLKASTTTKKRAGGTIDNFLKPKAKKPKT